MKKKLNIVLILVIFAFTFLNLIYFFHQSVFIILNLNYLILEINGRKKKGSN